MQCYRGYRDVCGSVHVNKIMWNGESKRLDPRFDLWNHSPTGFEWGYEGSGPAQLALAILADLLVDDREAVRLHQKFKQDVIAKLPKPGWQLTGAKVEKAIGLG